jgi:hypothetical protein
LLARTGEVKLQHIYRKIYTGIGKFIGIVDKPKKYNCFEILFMKIIFFINIFLLYFTLRCFKLELFLKKNIFL